ncbi:hypothetical protein PLEOSDRAFT_170612 [Pleurotus ostreatus PC15]|uniref:Uncharacterized protein n=1 Tax=Pleurotus ostreatus (strain PC15) TaxID=1137138 RepID=A0A067N8D8_PLEO1|nr:hypothetical protein PLEOSDRAFT_170612 [Pleurotus ostreatus PC15]
MAIEQPWGPGKIMNTFKDICDVFYGVALIQRYQRCYLLRKEGDLDNAYAPGRRGARDGISQWPPLLEHNWRAGTQTARRQRVLHDCELWYHWEYVLRATFDEGSEKDSK